MNPWLICDAVYASKLNSIKMFVIDYGKNTCVTLPTIFYSILANVNI